MNGTSTEAADLATLLDIARSVSLTLELGPLLQLILDELKVVADYSGSSICVVEGDDLCIMESRGGTPDAREEGILGVRLPLNCGGRFWQQIALGEPVIIDDVRGTTAMAAAYRRFVGPQFDSAAIRYIRSFLAVPLRHRDDVIGLLTLSKTEPRFYTTRHAELAGAIAVHAAAAIANARLYEATRNAQAAAARQVERWQTLMSITRELLVATDVNRVLDLVVTAATRLVSAHGATVGLVQDEAAQITVAATTGEPFAENTPANEDTQPAISPHPAITQVLARGEPTQFLVAAPSEPSHADVEVPDAREAGTPSRVVVVPMLVEHDSIGVLRVHDVADRHFVDDDVRLIQSLANQGALAIAHARLLTRGNDAVVLEERARLARDLHDSVTQSLFSLGMLAGAAHRQHERNDDRLQDTLARVANLAQETLVEMRALLFELHPQSLVEKGLVQALADLVATVGRDGGPTPTFSATTDRQPPPAVSVPLFRIAQEALANARKHAEAVTISVDLAEADGVLVLTITDDGVGFDPTAPRPSGNSDHFGGMGLRSMRDRAAAAGIAFHVQSNAEGGTTVQAAVSLAGADTATPRTSRA